MRLKKHILLALVAAVALIVVPAHAPRAHAGPWETCVVDAPRSTPALDAPFVRALAYNRGSDYHPDVRPFYNYVIIRVVLDNAGNAPFSYSPEDFTLEDPIHGDTYTADMSDSYIAGTQLAPGILSPGGRIGGDIAYKVYSTYDIQTSYILHWSHTTVPVPFPCT